MLMENVLTKQARLLDLQKITVITVSQSQVATLYAKS